MKKILIIRLSALGDVVQTLDALKQLEIDKKKYFIAWAVSEAYADLVDGENEIDEVIKVPKHWSVRNWWKFKQRMKRYDFDILIDHQSLLKSYLVALSIRHREYITFGKKTSRDLLVPRLAKRTIDGPFLSSRASYLKLLQEVMKPIKKKEKSRHQVFKKNIKKILCAPGSGWPTKQLSHEQWDVLLRCIRDAFPKAEISFIAGNDIESDWLEQIWKSWGKYHLNRCPKMSLKELKDQMSDIDLWIGMDSGPSHLASQLNVPTFIFYGPSLPSYYDKNGEGDHAARGDCHLQETFSDRCKKLRVCSSCSAIQSIDVKEVWEKFLHRHML